MKIPKEEREQYRQAFRQMSPIGKLDYILTYYKVEVVVGLLALIVLCSVGYRQLTKKTPVLYEGFVNVEAGEELQERLTTDFLVDTGRSPRKQMIQLYQGLYLTDDPTSIAFQYVYASRLKVLASIESHQMDVMLMNREAYDTFSQSGYLLQLDEYFAGDPALTTNLVIYEDNAEAHSFDETIPYEAVTGEEANALDCSDMPFFKEAGFTEPLYLGIIANTNRLDCSLEYLEYLMN